MTITDITAYEAPGGVDIMTPAGSTAASIELLEAHARAMGTAHKLAVAMCNSDLVPAIYKGKPDNGAAAILYGLELGLTPIQAMQQIFVVRGVPAIFARTMVALVLARGHKVWTVESTDTSVTVSARRSDDPDHEITATWTYERAEKAGYTSNTKYQTDPQSMLYAKAATEVCRRAFPDILLGISQSAEELQSEQGPQSSVVQQEKPAASGWESRLGITAEKKAEPENAPAEPKVEEKPAPAKKAAPKKAAAPKAETPEPAPAEEKTADPATTLANKDQLLELSRLLEVDRVDTTEAKLEWINNSFGTEYTDPRQMTEQQADQSIAYLAKAQAKDADK